MNGRTLAVGLAAAVVMAGCGGASATPLEPGVDFTVVTDLDPIADLVKRVSGDRAEVVSLVPTGLDGHTYEPRPSDLVTLSTAHLFIGNGGGLNPAIDSMALGNLPDGSPMVALAELSIRDDELMYTDVHSHDGGPPHGHTGNAHLWTNIAFAERYVDQIAAALSDRDPAGAEYYLANVEELHGQLRALSQAAREAISSVPAEHRKLVVYHDAWSYFGREFGIEVIGAIQPADFSEPSAAEIRDMVQQIREEEVPAFFGSEVFPSDVLDVVARESGASYVGDLNDDWLPGQPGDADHSYVGMMVHNVSRIVDALGGDPAPLDQVELEPAA